MDGVIAKLLSSSEHSMQDRVQKAILETFQGEQPVGTCLILSAFASADYLAYAPTMRVPQNSSKSLNAYLAFRAVLLAVVKFRPKVKSLVCTAFCTGAGHMPPVVAATQMRLAWDSVFAEESCPRPVWRHIGEFDRKLQATLSLR